MKKRGQQNIVDFKADQINKMVSDALTALNTKMQQTAKQMTEAEEIVSNLQENVSRTLSDLKQQQITLSPEEIVKRLNTASEKPAFWRKNLDYGAEQRAFDGSYVDAKRTMRLRDEIYEFANTLNTWNLNYDQFPDISDWIDKNMREFPYGQDVVDEYLMAAMRRRSQSYWDVRPSRYEIDQYKDISNRLVGILKDLAGDELQNRF